MESRGIPEEYLNKEVSSRTPEQIKSEESRLAKLFPNINSDMKSKGQYVAIVLAKQPLTSALEYLREEIVRLLSEIDSSWGKIKPQGKKAIVDMAINKTENVSDAKGAIGELKAVAFTLEKGSEVNLGGPDKTLPDKQVIGGIETQDIDVRYLENKNGSKKRVYIEAKYDTKTLIDKYSKLEKGQDKIPQQARYEAIRDKKTKKMG